MNDFLSSNPVNNQEPKRNFWTRFFNKKRNAHARHSDPNSNKDSWLSALSTIAILLAAPLVAILITTFVFQSYQVDGSSMETTLHDGDRLIVWKVGRTWARITGGSYTPNRGDVIIFSTPNLASVGQDPSKQLIKRVIGLPGERIVVHDEAITIYNKEHPNGFNPDHTLPYGKVITNTGGEIDMTIPKDKVFVCGDNRDNSLDSRIDSIGPIDTKYIVGKLAVRVWPLNTVKAF